MNTKRFWLRAILIGIHILLLFHSLKDLTQDILGVATPLDLMGNIREDVTRFPVQAQTFILALGYVSFIVELILLVTIPFIIKNDQNKTLRKLVFWLVALLFSYYLFVAVLDPRVYLIFK